MKSFTERSATIKIDEQEKISRELEVFYNPVMELNRDFSILVLKAFEKDQVSIADILAGTGVRAIRMLKELDENKISSILVNDMHNDFPELFAQNAKLSELDTSKIQITNEDARRVLENSKGFDYIEIDPFGSPNPFLDTSIHHLKRGGILAVTATDTAPLCGTYPKACQRKYWAKPSRTHHMHEVGLRILIRKVQLVAAQYDLALTPVVSMWTQHYFRIYFRMLKGKMRTSEILDQHSMIEQAGPLWLGNLWETEFLERMLKAADDYPAAKKKIELFIEESKIKTVNFYDLHQRAEELQLSAPPKTQAVIDKLQQINIPAARTHFCGHGLRAACEQSQLDEVLRSL